MREIKFRIWDIENKCWLCDGKYNQYIPTKYEPIMVTNFRNGTYQFFEREDVEVMEYTGLKDYREKEIYEGDILFCSQEDYVFLQLIGFGATEKYYDNVLKGFKIVNGCILENDNCQINEFKPLTQELIRKHNIPLDEEGYISYDGWWVIGNKYENVELMNLLEEK